MSRRREGRETAVQLLYSRDFHPAAGEPTIDEDIDAFFSLHTADKAVRAHAESLFRLVVERRNEIDERLSGALENFSLERLSGVDRNILRLAIGEMFYCPEVPPVVAMNEAIEIAKRFGTPDSSRFVNGVLDRLGKDLTRPLRKAARH